MSQSESTLGVALVGCGTVGSAVAAMLTRDQEILRARVGPRLELRHIVDIDFRRAEAAGLDRTLFTQDVDKAIADPAVGAVVELIGGVTAARAVIEKALKAGKSVVTANKALLAEGGVELLALARRHGATVAFEASCAGGIPIVRAICDGLIANRIDAIYGIVNGTCNYILTAMTQGGRTYAQALAEAQRAGLAEADPTLDVSGLDSAHKLAILAALAFGGKIDLAAIPVAGIDSLDPCDVAFGGELGYVVKLLAIAQRQASTGSACPEPVEGQEDGVSLRVRPAFISKEHPLAWVSGCVNAVSVYGHATGHTMYYGRGAGGMPTASAVVADLVAVALGTAQRAFEHLAVWPDRAEAAKQLPIEAVRSRYYLRVMAEDAPGVLAQVAAVLGRHRISIRSVLQHEALASADQAGVPVVITTHQAVEGNVQAALAEVDALGVIKASSVCISIVEEYPEPL